MNMTAPQLRKEAQRPTSISAMGLLGKKSAAASKYEEKEEKPPKVYPWGFTDEYFANIFYVLGAGYAYMALATIVLGIMVRAAEEKYETFPVVEFIQMATAMSYLYLFMYGWMLVGPIPLRGNFKKLKIAWGVYGVVAVGVWGFGSYATLSMASSLGADRMAPWTYRVGLTLVSFFFIGLFGMGFKITRHVLKKRHEMKQAKKWAMLKEEVDDDHAAEVEAKEKAAADKAEKKKAELAAKGEDYDPRFDDSDSD